ncbi:MAG: hypothetical protein RLY47_297 [Candidatus Parcubacteria bacterium]|jgi:hypothetical protein
MKKVILQTVGLILMWIVLLKIIDEFRTVLVLFPAVAVGAIVSSFVIGGWYKMQDSGR